MVSWAFSHADLLGKLFYVVHSVLYSQKARTMSTKENSIKKIFVETFAAILTRICRK